MLCSPIYTNKIIYKIQRFRFAVSGSLRWTIIPKGDTTYQQNLCRRAAVDWVMMLCGLPRRHAGFIPNLT